MPQEHRQASGDDWYRYALALEASQEGFWDWDLVANRLRGSSRWQSITGISSRDASLEGWLERVHPLDKAQFEAELRALRLGKTERVRNQHRIRHGNGTWCWVEARAVVARDGGGHATHVAGSLVDNTEQRTADPLTGLPNRVFFLDHVEQRLERGRLRGDWRFAVLAVALDRFDRVNETLGCGGGDRLLLETAGQLEAMLPECSVAARLTGAEFLVCLEPVRTESEAADFAAAAAEALRQPFVWRGHRVGRAVAVGVAQASASYAHPEELMGDAASALAEARRLEPPGVACYSNGMRERALEKLDLEADLERAIQLGELVMYYQPEVDLETNRIVGFEALVRWNHRRRGLLPPAEFIPLAEETGLILPLGDWGMKEACRQLVAWRQGGSADLAEVRVSVNLSAKQFDRPDLVERVRQVLVETGLGPENLRLEVTESSLITDEPAALETMRALGKLGVGLDMDDFGTGYSSFDYLQRFPFDTLKIDRSFVQEVAHDRESHHIVRSILDLARSFGMSVVAEGIERAEQLEALRALGCRCGQGFYFARPMAPQAIDALVGSGSWRPAGEALASA